jgi:polar amino acid transport system permease protein
VDERQDHGDLGGRDRVRQPHHRGDAHDAGTVPFPLRLLGTVYVDVFRGLPLLLVIFLLGFGGPALDLSGLPRSALFWGCASLVLSYSAYVAEVFRAGIESVHQSQRLAGRALV